MNIKRLLLAVIAAFVFIFATNFLIHGVWLMPDYVATASLWRTNAEMAAHLPWLLASEFLYAAMFVLLWAKGFAREECILCACIYGLCMGLFQQAAMLMIYAVAPMPLELVVKWVVSGLAQGVLLAVVTFFVYKPAPGQKN